MMLHEILPHRLDVTYRNQTALDTDICLLYDGANVLAKESETVSLPTVAEIRAHYGIAEDTVFQYLFSIDELRFFTVIGLKAETFGDYVLQTMRWLRITKPLHFAYAAALGSQIAGWYVRNRFCGRCGHETVHDAKERMMRCPSCGNMIFPQICPSVIVGVIDRAKERMLLTKYNPAHLMPGNPKVHNPLVNYALVAGYVESGETPEETVAREVMEEVGLRVKNIRYFRSQPWPFSGALLFGYFCDLDGDDTVTLEENELSVAEWKTRDEMPDRSQDVSLTSLIMETFRTGKV